MLRNETGSTSSTLKLLANNMKAFLVISALVAACSAAPANLLAAPWASPLAYNGLAYNGLAYNGLAAPLAYNGLAAPLAYAAPIEDGQYRTGLLDSAIDLRGQYYPEAEKYVADNEGAYQADDEGAYKPDAEGRYIADDEGAYKPDAEGAYDAASAHAKEALSEDGSYKGEPLHTAIASGIVKPVAYAAAPIAAPLAYAAAPAVRTIAAPWAFNQAYNPLAYHAPAVLSLK
ncbi:uncharacterized protein LOC132197856 [Neocloeon triangulifer]|uniref:uncharacterized protein LOC132197856 n=1 Tax=Neocloeon triangulifer TaxID=2078957 RepID=UPI00286F4444|nr:uncharacterized protein LOC132197856 [Neocloeon triangulifer]